MKLIKWIFIMTFMSQLHFIEGQEIIPVWPDEIPGCIDDPDYQEFLDTDEPYRIRQVSLPTLTVYRPDRNNTTGAAIIICPGGGYHRLAYDHEGFQVAEWLQSIGITGIVLKYRLPDERIMIDKATGPLNDVLQAIRMIRSKSISWGIDPGKIGVMGFSAGGHLAASASVLYNNQPDSLNYEFSTRPDFSILVYPVISFQDSITHEGSRQNLLGPDPAEAQKHRFSADEQVNDQTPPALLIHSLDDGAVDPQNSINYLNALRHHGVSCELHLYETGGHGYGITRGKGSEKDWPETAAAWLRMHGWIE